VAVAAGARICSVIARLTRSGATAAASGRDRLTGILGGAARARVILVLAGVLGLSSADVATVGASATQLRHALSISNTDLGLLVTVASLVAAVATVPFGVLADRVRRTWTLGAMVTCWGAAMIWSATADSFTSLLLARVLLGVATAAAGPMIASLTGDYFPGSERGSVYGYILTGDLLGAGFGFAVTGDVAALSWRAAFALLALPAFGLAWTVIRLRRAAACPAERPGPRSGPDPRRRSAPAQPAGRRALRPARPHQPGADHR